MNSISCISVSKCFLNLIMAGLVHCNEKMSKLKSNSKLGESSLAILALLARELSY